MTTIERLQEAMQHMQEAEMLINEAKNENHSLDKYYGYLLQVISRQLIRFSDNSAGHPGRVITLQEIIDAEGKNWHSKEIRLERERRIVENTSPEKTTPIKENKTPLIIV